MTSNKNSTILLLTALIAAILFALYYYLLTPKLEEVEVKESTVQTLEHEINTIQEQKKLVNREQQSQGQSPFALQKKVPPTRSIEDIIRSIEEIEAVTGTRVEAIDFNNYDELVMNANIQGLTSDEQENPAETTTESEEVPQEGQVVEDSEEDELLPTTAINKESLPEELKLVTFSMDVAALKVTGILEFLKELEAIERVMKIDLIDFELAGEEATFNEELDTTIKATVQVTTFYYEEQQ